MKKYKVRLTREKSNHNNLRTDVVEGEAERLPEICRPFVMFAESLTPGGMFRMIHTTEVREIETTDELHTLIFRTANSTYRLSYEEAKCS